MANTHLCKITAGGDSFYLLCTKHTNGEDAFESFELMLSDGSSVWHGFVPAKYLQSHSKNLHMDEGEHFSQTYKAFTNDKNGNFSFVYEVKATKNGKTFTWKRFDKAEDIKFQLGSVSLDQDTTPSTGIFQMLDHALESASTLQESVKSLQHENERLKSERQTDIQRLDQLAKDKDNIEKELFSKFVLVLNEKKKKLRELSEQINALSPAECSVSIQSTSELNTAQNTNNGQKNARKLADNEDTGSEYDTDEEVKTSVAKTMKVSATSDVKELLGESSDGDNSVPVVRRRRCGQTRSRQKQEAVKPTLSKTSSDKSTAKRHLGLRSKQQPASSPEKSCDDTYNLMDDI